MCSGYGRIREEDEDSDDDGSDDEIDESLVWRTCFSLISFFYLVYCVLLNISALSGIRAVPLNRLHLSCIFSLNVSFILNDLTLCNCYRTLPKVSLKIRIIQINLLNFEFFLKGCSVPEFWECTSQAAVLHRRAPAAVQHDRVSGRQAVQFTGRGGEREHR